MLVPSLHCTVRYLLTSFFRVCSWSTVPVGSCTLDIKGLGESLLWLWLFGVKKPLCKRTNCCLLSESTLEKTLARNLLREQEKSRSSWRNIQAVVECMGWSYISGKLGFGAELQYVQPWQLLCLSPTVGIFFLCLFLNRNNPAASFTQRMHLASEEAGRQSFASCICSGTAFGCQSTAALHGLLLACLLIWPSTLLPDCWNHDSQLPFKREEKRKTKLSKLAALVLDTHVLSCPFPGKRHIFSTPVLIQCSVSKWPSNKTSW